MKGYLVDEHANKYYIWQRREEAPPRLGMCQVSNREWTLHSHKDTLEALTNRKIKYSLYLPPEIHETLRLEQSVTSNATFKVGGAHVTIQIQPQLSTVQFTVEKETKEDYTLKFNKEILKYKVGIGDNSHLILILINQGEGDSCVARISTIEAETHRYMQLAQYEIRDILYFGATLYLLEDGVVLYGDIKSFLRPLSYGHRSQRREKTFKGNKETIKQIFQCESYLGLVTSANFIQVVSGGRVLHQFRTGVRVEDIFYICPFTFLIEIQKQFYVFHENLLTKIHLIGVQGVLVKGQYAFAYSSQQAWMFKWSFIDLHLWEVSSSFGLGLRNAFAEE